MAKMFYTMEEARAALGRTEEEIKQLTREGKLREFRDGTRLMFKADQVEQLKGTLASKEAIDIGESGSPISLVDSRGGTGAGGSGAGITMKEDSTPGEIGLGGSFGGIPSPRSGSRSGSGIDIFQPDEVDPADPSAATAITPGDQTSLETAGSGSGLLDLTKESDDTSLGGVLDEIGGKRDPGSSRAGTAVGVAGAAGVAGAQPPPLKAAPIVVQKPDPNAPLFGGLALGGAILSIYGLLVLTSAVQGATAPLVEQIIGFGFLVFTGISVGIAIVLAAVGFGLGKVLR